MITIDVFVYDRHVGGITVDSRKNFVFEPEQPDDQTMLENMVTDARRRIPGRLSNVQLLAKLPTFYRGAVFAEIRNS